MQNAILGFFGNYRFLSNFFEVPGGYLTETILRNSGQFQTIYYPTLEHAYQASKTTCGETHYSISVSYKDPKTVKFIGRSLPMRNDWDLVKDAVMFYWVQKKFTHPTLAQWLIDTYPLQLIEANYWGDYYWGCDYSLYGENRLGEILMDVRDGLLG